MLLVPALVERGHTVAIIAPAVIIAPPGTRIFQVRGDPPSSLTTAKRDAEIVIPGSDVLDAMWDCARQVQNDFDIIVGMTYDWISYVLTPGFQTPVIHWITVSSTIDTVDRVICESFKDHPNSIAFYSQTQADTFKALLVSHANLLPGAVDTSEFRFSPAPQNRLSWAARISPEKGLEDAVSIASRAGLPLDVCGKMQDRSYWDSIMSRSPGAAITYHGMVPHAQLAKVLGNSIAMLATPKWTEAFGLSLVEALACGTPVLAYARGGPAGIVEHGKSGYLVPPDDSDAMLRAVRKVPELNRLDARARAEEFGIAKLASRFEDWIGKTLHTP